VPFAEIFRRNYGGLFSKGFDNAQREAKQLSIPETHAIFTKCLSDAGRLQVNGTREEVIRSEGARLGVPEDDIAKLVALYNQTRMGHDEIMEVVIQARDYMRGVYEIWKSSSMGRFTLTSVGIAIGHANLKKSAGEFTDLAIWIN
jgi:hypothetical protein